MNIRMYIHIDSKLNDMVPLVFRKFMLMLKEPVPHNFGLINLLGNSFHLIYLH